MAAVEFSDTEPPIIFSASATRAWRSWTRSWGDWAVAWLFFMGGKEFRGGVLICHCESPARRAAKQSIELDRPGAFHASRDDGQIRTLSGGGLVVLEQGDDEEGEEPDEEDLR